MTQLRASDGLAALLLLLTVVSLVIRYITPETGFYWWDYADYHNYAILMAEAFNQSPNDGWEFLRQSLSQQKNGLHILPLLPIIQLGDHHRLAYILSLALIYLIPFSLGMGAIATELPLRHLGQWGKRPVFWFTTVLTLLLPMTWIPMLRGYPDIGGAMVLVWATWLYLRYPRLRQSWQILALGAMIALMVLLRRHFAYSALTLLLAVALSQPIGSRKDWQKSLILWLRLAMVGIVSLIVMVIVAPEFTQKAMTTDFSSRYQLWSLPLGVMLSRTGAAYGWGLWAMAIVGWLVSQRWGQLGWRVVGMAAGLSLGVVLLKLRYGNLHYTLHLTPWLVLGLLAFIEVLLDRVQRRWGLVLLGAYVLVNVSSGLGMLSTGMSLSVADALPESVLARVSLKPLLAKAHPPLVRQDRAELERLLLRLQGLSQQQQTVALLAASNQVNASMFQSEAFQRFENSLTLLPVAIFDGPVSPWETVLEADVVIVATPPQLIELQDEQVVRSQSQTMIRLISEAFLQNQALTEKFRRLPDSFELQGGVQLWLYERCQPRAAQ
ncbi:hypothetical protein AY600_18045 [Phormidium willei BDU 130791]|nr:hypothetical protein AY600_18045 [Phormidium willei BDU 130791]